MTSTNIGAIKPSISAFKRLDIDNRLAVLGLLYNQIADKIPANAIDNLPTENTTDLVAQIQQLSPEEQRFALRDILPAERTDQDETMLDPHPSKAMIELTHGGNKIPTGQYGHLNSEAKLAFWYFLAERLGTTIIGIPSDFQPSKQALELLDSLKSQKTDDLVTFLKAVL